MFDVAGASEATGKTDEPRHDALESTAGFDNRHFAQDPFGPHVLHPAERIAPGHDVSVRAVDHPVKCQTSGPGLVADDVADGDTAGLHASDPDDVPVAQAGLHAGPAGAEAEVAVSHERQAEQIGAPP
jgi:hypothetical protein